MPMSLSLGLSLGGQQQVPQSNGPLCDAIARRVCVTAKNGNHELLFAPHVVYHGHSNELDTDGVLIERDGKKPNKLKIETLKVASLTDIAVTDQSFTHSPGFDPSDAKYAGKAVCVVAIV